MKRWILILLFVAPGLAIAAADWWTPYDQGLVAIEKNDWKRAAQKLGEAIAVAPEENNRALHRNRAVEYLPHYWLGVAKYQLGDTDGAIASWKESELQGKIQKTSQYAELRKWFSRVEAERQKAKGAASQDSRSIADEALNKALSSQMQAVAAGADRDSDFRTGQQRLQDAWKVFNAAGNDAGELERAAEMARSAGELFDKAVVNLKGGTASSRPTLSRKTKTEPPVAPPPVAPTPVSEDLPAETGAKSPIGSQTANQGLPTTTPPVPDRGETPSVSRVEELSSQQPTESARKEVATARSDGEVLRRAWSYFAAGDMKASEALLTALIETGSASAESHLLRGCVRYTRGMMLGRNELVDEARTDFTIALQRKPYLKLDKSHFSPRLVDFFNEVRLSL